MVLAEDLRQAVLQAALQGKLTEQLETDSDVDEMLKHIAIYREEIKECKNSLNLEAMDIEIPDSWRMIELNSILSFVDYRGKTPNKIEKGIFLITASNIKKGYMDYARKEYISEEEYRMRQSRGTTNRGDLLFTTEAPLGNAAICDLDITSCGQRIITMKAYCENTVCLELFMYFILSSAFQNELLDNCTGTTAKGIKADKLKHLLIPLPPIEEQHRIVDKINEIMSKIDEYEMIEKGLDALKKEFPTNMRDALLQAAMQGKLTEQLESDSSVDELLTFIQKEKKQLIEEKKIYKNKKLVEDVENKFDIDIPNNWRFVNLQEICTQITDGEHKTPNRVSEYQGYYLLSARNILNGKLVLDDVDYVSKEEYDVISKRCNPHRNDILISCSGTVGRCCLISDDNNYVMVRSAAMIHCLQMNNKYIMYAIQSPYIQAQIDGLKKQSVQANLFQSAIASLLIPIPPIEEQQRIVERLDTLLPLCDDLKEE